MLFVFYQIGRGIRLHLTYNFQITQDYYSLLILKGFVEADHYRSNKSEDRQAMPVLALRSIPHPIHSQRKI